LLFYAMRADISPGLASLLVQMQVFFTITLSVWIFGERFSTGAVIGGGIAAAGLLLIGIHLDQSVITRKGVLLIIGAAAGWAAANTVVKQAVRVCSGSIDMLSFVVWSSIFAVPPLAALAIGFEGWHDISQSITNARRDAWLALIWQVAGNTLFGFAVWNRLLQRYEAAVIMPFALLVPVFGMASSAMFLGESLPVWKLVAAGAVVCGIAVPVFAKR